MPLFKVSVEFDLYVVAESASDAAHKSIRAAKQEIDVQDPACYPTLTRNPAELDDDTLASYAYGQERGKEKTVRELFA